MPGLGRTQQVLIMMLLWALLLIVIDKRMNVHPERTTGVGSAKNPQLIFGLNHLCCSGCFDNVFKAIKQQSWLANPTLYSDAPLQSQQEAHTVKPHASATYFGQVKADLDAGQANIIDLMKIYRDIEIEGLALENFKMVNVPHFELHILLPHLCCPTCKDAVGKICDLSPQNQLYDDLKDMPTLKKAIVESDGATLEFQGDTPTDMAQVLRVLHRIGYVPKEMHLSVLQ
jgi:hypothetical protein